MPRSSLLLQSFCIKSPRLDSACRYRHRSTCIPIGRGTLAEAPAFVSCPPHAARDRSTPRRSGRDSGSWRRTCSHVCPVFLLSHRRILRVTLFRHYCSQRSLSFSLVLSPCRPLAQRWPWFCLQTIDCPEISHAAAEQLLRKRAPESDASLTEAIHASHELVFLCGGQSGFLLGQGRAPVLAQACAHPLGKPYPTIHVTPSD